MAHLYGTTAVERLYIKLEPELNKIARNIVAKLSGSVTYNEVRTELGIKFYQSFTEYYEDRKQYCGFIYTATLNAMRNALRRENTKEKHFTSNERILAREVSVCQDESGGLDNNQIWGNVPDPRDEFKRESIKEIIEKSRILLARFAETDEEVLEAKVAMECVMTGVVSMVDVNKGLNLRRVERTRSLKGHERTSLNRIEAKVVEEDDSIADAIVMQMSRLLDLIENVIIPALLEVADDNDASISGFLAFA